MRLFQILILGTCLVLGLALIATNEPSQEDVPIVAHQATLASSFAASCPSTNCGSCHAIAQNTYRPLNDAATQFALNQDESDGTVLRGRRMLARF